MINLIMKRIEYFDVGIRIKNRKNIDDVVKRLIFYLKEKTGKIWKSAYQMILRNIIQ